MKLPALLVAPALSVLAALVALVAWSWAPALVAGTPLADLGFAVNLAALIAALGLLDRLLDRIGHAP